MTYEVLISTTIAIVLLPLNFWAAAELVIIVALFATCWEFRRTVFEFLAAPVAILRRCSAFR